MRKQEQKKCEKKAENKQEEIDRVMAAESESEEGWMDPNALSKAFVEHYYTTKVSKLWDLRNSLLSLSNSAITPSPPSIVNHLALTVACLSLSVVISSSPANNTVSKLCSFFS